VRYEFNIHYSILAWEGIRNKYLIIGNSAGKISSEGRDALKEDAEHIDLYDRVDRIPFDKLESFFRDSMK